MLKALRTLIGAAQRTDATADELTVSMRNADTELQAARAALAQAHAAFRSGLLDADDARLDRLREAKKVAHTNVQRARAVVNTLAQRHADAVERQASAIEREAQAAKIERYEAAARRASEMREVLLEMYPAAAQAVVDIIRALAETEIEVEAANADLPAGVEPIPGVEASIRNRPGTLPHLVGETEVFRWCYAGDARPDAFGQEYVEVTPDGRGMLRDARGGVEYVIRRPFLERRYAAFDPGVAPDRLASSVSLPGIRGGDRPFFVPFDRRGLADPRAVLKSLDQPASVSPSAPADRVEWVLVGTIDVENELRRPSKLAGLLSE